METHQTQTEVLLNPIYRNKTFQLLFSWLKCKLSDYTWNVQQNSCSLQICDAQIFCYHSAIISRFLFLLCFDLWVYECQLLATNLWDWFFSLLSKALLFCWFLFPRDLFKFYFHKIGNCAMCIFLIGFLTRLTILPLYIVQIGKKKVEIFPGFTKNLHGTILPWC